MEFVVDVGVRATGDILINDMWISMDMLMVYNLFRFSKIKKAK